MGKITVLNTEADRFPNTEGMLANWKNQGLYTKAAVDSAEANFKKTKQSGDKKNPAAAKSGYKQTNYDFAALKKFIDDN